MQVKVSLLLTKMRSEVRKNRPVRCGTLHTTFHTEDPGTWKSSVSLCKLQGCAVTWLWRESFIKWSRQLQDLVVFGWYPSPSALDLEEASLRSVQRHTGRRHLHVFQRGESGSLSRFFVRQLSNPGGFTTLATGVKFILRIVLFMEYTIF